METHQQAQLSCEPLIKELVTISREAGSDLEMVIAAGGNTSAKSDDGKTIFVKISGECLATIGPEGFVALSREALFEILDQIEGLDPVEKEKRYEELVKAARLQDEAPSVEVVLHNLLPEKFVVHTHPRFVNMLACSEDGEELAKNLFAGSVLWIPAVNPGCTLAREVRDRLNEYLEEYGREPTAIIIQNHGLFIGGDNLDDVRHFTAYVLHTIKNELAWRPLKDPFGARCVTAPPDNSQMEDLSASISDILRKKGLKNPESSICTEDGVMELVCSSRGKKEALAGPVTPDHEVYCRIGPIWIDDSSPEIIEQQITQFLDEHKYLPRVFLIEKGGMIVIGENPRATANARALYLDQIEVMKGAMSFGGNSPMPEALQIFIRDWDAERKRQARSNT